MPSVFVEDNERTLIEAGLRGLIGNMSLKPWTRIAAAATLHNLGKPGTRQLAPPTELVHVRADYDHQRGGGTPEQKMAAIAAALTAETITAVPHGSYEMYFAVWFAGTESTRAHVTRQLDQFGYHTIRFSTVPVVGTPLP